MIKPQYFVLIALAGIVFLLSAFQVSSSKYLSYITDTIAFILPKNFPAAVYNFDKNPVTKAGFTLGKTLFYDPGLSADGSVSCGSCHQSSAAFANLGSAVSTGVKLCKGKRNAPPLFNLAWQKEFMWDGRINAVHLVPVNALTSDCEMGNSIQNIVNVLQVDRIYPSLFKQAFGSDKINRETILNALSQFTLMLVSANSKYDRMMRRETGAAFSPAEQAGYELFKQQCSTCHTEPLFTDLSYRNNGLEEKYADIGRDSLTKLTADLSKFRVPTLRNIEITGPYMHDGRFNTLKEVLQHYSNGMKIHVNLDPIFRKNGSTGIKLTSAEQNQLVAFLKTLTDIDFINDRRFNNN